MAISAPTEITAAATLVQFWDVDVSPAVWITVFGVFIVVVNFCGVRLYGEVCASKHFCCPVLTLSSRRSSSPRSKSCSSSG